MNIFKPTWKKIIMALLGSVLFGLFLGINLYYAGSCWFSDSCAAYSPIKLFFAYIFSWPILVMGKLLAADSDNFVNNFDPVIFHKFGWLVIFLYYYLLVCVIEFIMKKRSYYGNIK